MSDVNFAAAANLFATTASLPFSFIYNGKSSRELLETWEQTKTEKQLDANRKQTTLIFTDKQTRLEVRCEVITYADYPAVEWVLYFRSRSAVVTPILENVQALDTVMARERRSWFTIHHARGSDWNIADFAPIETHLANGKSLQLSSGHMSSMQALPFFNVEVSHTGAIIALGWSGKWKADFNQDSERTLKIQAGMDSTHLRLQAGEEIRTPRMLMLFWEGDRIDAHNQWRRLLLEYYSPRPDGKAPVLPLAAASWGAQTEAAQLARIKWNADNKLPYECYWIDAGWSGETGPDDQLMVTWLTESASRIFNPDYYPRGLRPVADAAHQAGMKFLLWHWPNRALPGKEIIAEHPEWLVMPGEGLDNGDPAVNKWMIDSNNARIADFAMDIYRQDGDPVYPVDAEDRQGASQAHHFAGFYEFWDAMLAKNPHLMIDNCAGGGRKIDLETVKRSVCLWRSDYQCDDPFNPIGMQNQTYGLALWAPLNGGVARLVDAYNFRTGYSAGMVTGFVADFKDPNELMKDFDVERARDEMNKYLALRECFYGDFYPLTSYSIADDVWMAWQFDRPDLGRGLVQVFRRPQSAYETARFKLRGLEAEANYEVVDIDENQPKIISGAELMNEGMYFAITEKPGVRVVRYSRAEK
jgi:alpha-galactosidase